MERTQPRLLLDRGGLQALGRYIPMRYIQTHSFSAKILSDSFQRDNASFQRAFSVPSHYFFGGPIRARRSKCFWAWLETCVAVRVLTYSEAIRDQLPRPRLDTPSRNRSCSSGDHAPRRILGFEPAVSVESESDSTDVFCVIRTFESSYFMSTFSRKTRAISLNSSESGWSRGGGKLKTLAHAHSLTRSSSLTGSIIFME